MLVQNLKHKRLNEKNNNLIQETQKPVGLKINITEKIPNHEAQICKSLENPLDLNP
jgi:hypothetical protein